MLQVPGSELPDWPGTCNKMREPYKLPDHLVGMQEDCERNFDVDRSWRA